MADDKEVRIDVTANDKASAVITDAAKNAEAAMKRLDQEQKKLDTSRKESFRNTKSSTEFFGQIANIAGGSEFAGVAGQLASLTEKTAQFSEVAKAGGAGALAFKAGLVAAAGAIGFQFGKALGDIVVETQHWTRELERADKAAAKLESRRLSAITQQIEDFRAGLEFSDDPTSDAQDRIAMLNAEIETLNKTIPATAKQLEKLQQQGELGWQVGGMAGPVEAAKDIGNYLASFVNDQQRLVAEKEKEIAASESSLELRRQEKQELERMLGVEKEREQLRKEQAETKQSVSFIESLQGQLSSLQSDLEGTTNITEAIKNTIAADRDAAIGLLDEIESTKQAIKDKQAEEQSAKRLADFKQSELDKLQEEILLLEKGKEAARAFRLEKQGLSKEDAAELASAESNLAALKEKPQKASELQAMESRLMVGGRGGNDVQDQIEKNTKEAAKLAGEQRTILHETKAILKQIADKNTVSLEVVA